jgi:hypothetical protein
MEDLVEAWERQKGRCVYSGVPLSLVYKDTNWSQSTASIDRINSSMGYIPGNIQWVHKMVNQMKMDMEETEFVAWCTTIANYSRGTCGS